MDWGFVPRKKKQIVHLQLAPLIDIFVLIIFFLIKGTYMGQASIEIPRNLKPAMSVSTEGMDLAPEVFAYEDSVFLKMIDKKLSSNLFDQGQDPRLAAVKNDFKKYFENISGKKKTEVRMVNFVADSKVSYQTVFNITAFLREVGFQDILFIAEGER
jgi:biopolymer transport protein ExbD